MLPPAASDPAHGRGLLGRRPRRQVIGVDRPFLQGNGELQQKLSDLQRIRPRAVVTLAKLLELVLQPQRLQLHLLQLTRRLVAFTRDCHDDRLENRGVIRQRIEGKRTSSMTMLLYTRCPSFLFHAARDFSGR